MLIDRRGRDENQLAGRSPWMQAVHVDFDSSESAQFAHGKTIDVCIMTARPNSLAALPLNSGQFSAIGDGSPLESDSHKR